MGVLHPTHETIFKLVLLVVAIVVISGGGAQAMAAGAVVTLDRLGAALRLVLVALALPAVLLGGAIAISPKHRQFGFELAGGGVVGLLLAAFAPAGLHWLGGTLMGFGNTLLAAPPAGQ